MVVSIVTTIYSCGKGSVPRKMYVLRRGFILLSEKETSEIWKN